MCGPFSQWIAQCPPVCLVVQHLPVQCIHHQSPVVPWSCFHVSLAMSSHKHTQHALHTPFWVYGYYERASRFFTFTCFSVTLTRSVAAVAFSCVLVRHFCHCASTPSPHPAASNLGIFHFIVKRILDIARCPLLHTSAPTLLLLHIAD